MDVRDEYRRMVIVIPGTQGRQSSAVSYPPPSNHIRVHRAPSGDSSAVSRGPWSVAHGRVSCSGIMIEWCVVSPREYGVIEGHMFELASTNDGKIALHDVPGILSAGTGGDQAVFVSTHVYETG